VQSFSEIDRAAFFDLETAREKIVPAQAGLLDALATTDPGGGVSGPCPPPPSSPAP
jgi:predicted NUDIX family NTP pyrophosphohydrolase